MMDDPFIANPELRKAANLIATYHRDSGHGITTFRSTNPDNPDHPVIIIASGEAAEVLVRAVAVIKSVADAAPREV